MTTEGPALDVDAVARGLAEMEHAMAERDRYRQALEAIVRGGGRTMPTYQWAAKTAREALHAA